MPRVKNFNIAVKEWHDQIVFLRKLVPGGTNRSYGIQVARLAGLPEKVISASKKILARIESKASMSDYRPVGFSTDHGDRSGPVQLDLFGPAESKILERVRSIDLDRTTPMEAIQLLQEFQTTLDKD